MPGMTVLSRICTTLNPQPLASVQYSWLARNASSWNGVLKVNLSSSHAPGVVQLLSASCLDSQ